MNRHTVLVWSWLALRASHLLGAPMTAFGSHAESEVQALAAKQRHPEADQIYKPKSTKTATHNH
eukprot:4531663-Pyramimonas_sp.AAC.1